MQQVQAGPALNNMQGVQIGGVAGYAPTPVKPITVEAQANTLESYVSQVVDLCGRAELLGDRLLGGAPAPASEKMAAPKAVANGIIDKIDQLSREFSGAIGRMERALQRIGDAL